MQATGAMRTAAITRRVAPNQGSRGGRLRSQVCVEAHGGAHCQRQVAQHAHQEVGDDARGCKRRGWGIGGLEHGTTAGHATLAACGWQRQDCMPNGMAAGQRRETRHERWGTNQRWQR